MNLQVPVALLLLAAAAGAPHETLADAPCGGHLLLPRPQGSCQNLKATPFISPDKKTIASVVAVDKSLNATPDMESNVVIRSWLCKNARCVIHSAV